MMNIFNFFKIFHSYPKELEGYSKGVRNFYLENKEKIEKFDDFIKTITKDIEKDEQVKEEHLAHIQKQDNKENE